MDQRIDRRRLMTNLATAGALMMTAPSVFAARCQPFFERMKTPIGLQLYTLGDAPMKDLDGTLAKVAAIGYRDLELPSLLGKKPAELKAAAAVHGLSFSSIHLGATPNIPSEALSLKSDTQRIVDDLGLLGVKDAVMPIMLLPDNFRMAAGDTVQSAIARALATAGADIWKKTAALLNEKALALKPHGIRLGYHNHNLEFQSVSGTTGWDILRSETDKQLVFFEIDTGWVAAAGLDPVDFLMRHKGRVRWLHLKDIRPSTKQNFALTMDPTEVGSGTLDWARILPAAHKAGVRHYYVEQEAPFTMPPMDAAAKGYAYLAQLKA